MANTPEVEEHLRKCADEALAYYDQGLYYYAYISVVANFHKSPLTKHLNVVEVADVIRPAVTMGRATFESTITNFDI